MTTLETAKKELSKVDFSKIIEIATKKFTDACYDQGLSVEKTITLQQARFRFNSKNSRRFNLMTIKEIKKVNSLSDADIARAFSYKSTMAYSNSSAKKRIDKGIEYIYNLKQSK
jgi:hypothetical protein